MKTFFTLISIGIGLVSWGQIDWNYYQPLKAKGNIPAEFTQEYADKYSAESRAISNNKEKSERHREETFHLRSQYFINEFLASGNVVFGDTISQYCEQILDHLLVNNQELRSKIRVYTVKSPEVNAFATDNGIICVNLGLIAQLENEAQLAYILAHEITHYKLDHVFDQFIEEEKIREGSDTYRRKSQDEKLLAMSTYSKSHEMEADREGFKNYYDKSGYSQIAPYYSMDIMQYSYLPFDEVAFDPSYLEMEYYSIPDRLLLDEISPITAEEDFDDSRSTHPNIKKRKAALVDLLDETKEGKDYIISEGAFNYCKRLARYENSRLYLNRLEYGQALYNTYLLEKTYGPDRYQKLMKAKTLAALSTYREESKVSSVVHNYKNVEGESQQVNYILKKISKKEIATMAVAFSYELVREYPGDQVALNIFENTLHDLVYDTGMRPNDYSHKNPNDTLDVKDIESLIDSTLSSRSSKIRNIKKKKLKEDIDEDKDFYKMAFVEFWEDSLFTASFEELAEEADDFSKGYRYSRSYTSNTYSKYDDNVDLGIDRILILTPKYLKLDGLDSDNIKYLTTDKSLKNYRSVLLEMAAKQNLSAELLDYKLIDEQDVDIFNDISILKNWTEERLEHENVGAQLCDYENVQYIREKYKTDYIAYTGVITLRVPEPAIVWRIIGSVMFPPMLPFMIADVVTPDFDSFNYFFLLDLKTGKALMAEYNSYESSDSPDYLRSVVYNYMLQIKTPAE